MFDQFSPDLPDVPSDLSHTPDIPSVGAPLPEWVARRILQPDEAVATVRGPRFAPLWEKFVTDPMLFVYALALAVAVIAVGTAGIGSWDDPAIAVPAAIGLVIVFGSVCVLAFFCALFTRLVVTDRRVMIVQGYEVRRTWKVDDLPPFLVRHQRNRFGEASRTLDLAALTSMMGASSDGFMEAKTIWALGKQIDQRRKEQRG